MKPNNSKIQKINLRITLGSKLTWIIYIQYLKSEFPTRLNIIKTLNHLKRESEKIELSYYTKS